MQVITKPQAVADWLRSRAVGELHCDSRRLRAGDGFVAWPGAATDGRRFVNGALEAGAVAALVEREGVESYAFDDDERVVESWFEVAHATLMSGRLDFIGGPMLPLWPSPPPAWIPQSYRAVLGIVDNGPDRATYTTEFPGMLVGGNAIIRRSVLESIDGFSPELGPQEAHRLMS